MAKKQKTTKKRSRKKSKSGSAPLLITPKKESEAERMAEEDIVDDDIKELEADVQEEKIEVKDFEKKALRVADDFIEEERDLLTEKAHSEKTSKGWWVLLAITIIGAAVLAVYVFSDVKSDDSYNDFPVREGADGLWYVTINVGEFPFHHAPWDVQDIPIEGRAVRLVRDAVEPVYIAINPNHPPVTVLAGVEVSKVTNQLFAIPTRSALTEAVPGRNATLKTCADATPASPVLVFELNSPSITTRGDCVILSALTFNDTLKTADRFSYTMLGITP